MILSMTACSPGQKSPPDSKEPADNPAVSDSSDPGAGQKPKKIALIVKVIGNQYWSNPSRQAQSRLVRIWDAKLS